MNDKQVAELFVEHQVLQPSQAEDVLNEANQNGKSIAQAMVDSGFVDEHGFYHTIADALGAEYVDLSDLKIPAGSPETYSKRACAASSGAANRFEWKYFADCAG